MTDDLSAGPRGRRFGLWAITGLTVAVILAVWYLASNVFGVSPLFLPSPQSVWKAFLTICATQYKGYTLWQHLGSSLQRLMIAFGLSVVTAVPLGLASGYVPWIKAIWEPIIEFYRPLPPLAYYTLLVLWMGIDNESKVMLLYLACFAPIYVACASAVMRIGQNYLRNARVLGARRGQVFLHVILPFALPEIFVGMHTALGVGYTTLVAAEMVAARSGIGWMVLDASNYLRSDIIFVGILVMGVTGILLDRLIRLAEAYCVPWKGKDY